MTTRNATEKVSYKQFRSEWLNEIEEGDPSPLEKGRRFATKLIAQWLSVTTDDDNFITCDGPGDGGIDIAYLKEAEVDTESREENAEEGDTWYLIQSKYGTAFAGASTIWKEGKKVIDTLQEQNQNLSEDGRLLIEKIKQFRKRSSNSDQIVLVFATTDPIKLRDRKCLHDIKILGRDHGIPNFDVEEVSLRNIWEAQKDVEQRSLSVSISGQFVEQSPGLLVGVVGLSEMFQFLKSYQKQMGSLDRLYDKNVRQFLGGRKKVNKGIADTLKTEPEKFGLYNNGITIVVSGYRRQPDDTAVTIDDPYVVNGCQTTKTIWQVLDSRLNAGGTGINSDDVSWREKVDHGGLVTKIARGKDEITKITKFTNSQNSVREKDFLALDSDFKDWAEAMAKKYNIFLEIQRGGTESRKAYEKQHPNRSKFDAYVNAFDLIKVYGAGWLAKPGLAFGKNAPFLPGGSVYTSIAPRQDEEGAFGVQDLYAAFRLKIVADRFGFGRTAEHASRRLSRFLFYYIIMSMLRSFISLSSQHGEPEVSANDLTDAVIKLVKPDAEEPLRLLSQTAISALDRYLTPGDKNSVHNEISYKEHHNSDLNALLKAEGLGKEDYTPLLLNIVDIHIAGFNTNKERQEQVYAVLREQ